MNDHILQNAWRLHQSGKFAEAARLYQEVLRMNPRHLGALQMLGFLHFQRGEFADAERIMEKAVKLDPKFAQAWYNLGLAYSALDKSELALESLVRAESLDARSPQIPYARATILARLGRASEARAAAQRALELRPNYAEAEQLLRALGR